MPTELQNYYAARAQEYDQVYEKQERLGDISRLKTWLPQQFRKAKLIDIACGTGYWTEHIAPVCTRVTGIDSSVETLTIAASRIQDVCFSCADVYRLPFRDHAFDAAFAGFWFSHVLISERQRFLNELARVLIPGAHVLLLDNQYVAGSNHPIKHTDAEGNTFQTRHLNNGAQHEVLKNFPTQDELDACIDDIADHSSYRLYEYYWVFEFWLKT